jgi:hypothetical protein
MLEVLLVADDNNKFSRRADRNRKMATKGHERGGRGDK